MPQVPGINFWRASGGGTSERGTDSPHVDFRGIADSHGRLMVVMTHNSDIGDSMERESEDPEFFAAFSPQGYQVTINMVLYALYALRWRSPFRVHASRFEFRCSAVRVRRRGRAGGANRGSG